MIFDISGLISFQPDFKVLSNNFFLYQKIYNKNYLNLNNLQVYYLTRGNADDSIFENEDSVIFIINDVFARQNAIKITSGNNHPLCARELFRLYQQFDIKFIQYIKGNFQIFISNKKNRLCLIFNSKFGVSPFYYYFVDNTLTFSTNLQAMINCGAIRANLDKIGAAEYAIFGYPLGDRTIFEDIKNLSPASYLIVKDNSIEVKKYWDLKDLIEQKLYPEKDALEDGSELFKKTIKLYAVEPDKICLSLTGGFDGRAILSVLEKKPENFLCYSFGIPGSLNVSIPEKICKENNINYLPIYLDEEYEKVFDEYAMQAIHFSDCLSTFERANYPYAFKKLSEFSPIIITGIFGSELMRTFQNVSIGYVVNKNFVELNFSQEKERMLALIISQMQDNSYYNSSIFDNNELIEHILDECIKKYDGLSDNQRFYFFLLNEGVRKYFGGEVHMERIYATNRFPFLDDDLVEFVFKSPFSGIYTNPLKPTVKQRFHSQMFYTYVIKKYRPELLNYITDHGYPPKYLLSKKPFLKIGPVFLINRLKQKTKGYREFKTEEWSEKYYRKYLLQKGIDKNLFSRRLNEDYETGIWKKNPIEFARAASLKLYLEPLFV